MKKIIWYIFLCIIALLFAAPILMTILRSFYTDTISMDKWKELLFNCFSFYRVFWNSCFYAICISLLQIILGIPCAFGLYMINNKITKCFVFICWLIMLMPPQITLLPNYIGLRDMGMLDTRIGVVLTMTFSTFVVVMVYQYLKGIDELYVEAARMETSSIIKVIWYIVMPTIKPAVLALFLFSFTDSYNMLEQPMFFIKDIRKQNLVIFISKVADTGKMFFPAAVIFMIPLIIIYMVVVKSIDNSILGECKGKRVKVLNIILIGVFWVLMIFFTFAGRSIHDMQLVKVMTYTPKTQMFSQQKGKKTKLYWLPYQFAKNDTYYIVSDNVINGEERTCANRISLDIGEAQNGHYPILNDEYNGETLIVKRNGRILDGEEVLIVQKLQQR